MMKRARPVSIPVMPERWATKGKKVVIGLFIFSGSVQLRVSIIILPVTT
jgi:hypothetical protein